MVLVSVASGDFLPVPEVVLKQPRELGRSSYNKQGMGKNKGKSVKRQALTENTLSDSSNLVPISPPHIPFTAKTWLIDDNSSEPWS